MNKEEYDAFYNALISGETVPLKDFEGSEVFEGCMPVEVMAKRGYDTMRFGMLKPVGLTDPKRANVLTPSCNFARKRKTARRTTLSDSRQI